MKLFRTISVIMVLALCFGAAQSVDAKKKKTRKRVAKTEKKQTVKQEEYDDRAVGGDDMSVAKPDENFVTEILAPLETAEEKKPEPKPERLPQNEEVYTTVAHMPQFPGGDAALMTYLSKNVRYPKVAQDNGVQGKVIVQFVVEKDGRVGEMKITRGVDKDLDHEALRVCKSLPKFNPGRNAEGDPVRVWYTLPITFKLNNNN